MELDNQQGRLFDIGWFVGVLESEGSISLNKTTRKSGRVGYFPRVTIVNSDDVVIENLSRILKDLSIAHYITKRRKTNGVVKSTKEIRDVLIHGLRRCDKLLEVVSKYMVSKADRAKILQEYIRYRLSKPYNYPCGDIEEDYFLTMRKLNGTLRDYTPKT